MKSLKQFSLHYIAYIQFNLEAEEKNKKLLGEPLPKEKCSVSQLYAAILYVIFMCSMLGREGVVYYCNLALAKIPRRMSPVYHPHPPGIFTLPEWGLDDFYYTPKLQKGALTSLSDSRIHLPAKYLKFMNNSVQKVMLL